jgi:gas vesicle protein
MSKLQGFLWGCAIGVGLGVLFAPRSGEETRAGLQSTFDQWQGLTQDQLTELREKASTAIEQGRQSVNTALDKAQNTTKLVADRAKEQVNRFN